MRYEFCEVFNTTAEELDRYGAEGWHVVSAAFEFGRLVSVLLEREKQ